MPRLSCSLLSLAGGSLALRSVGLLSLASPPRCTHLSSLAPPPPLPNPSPDRSLLLERWLCEAEASESRRRASLLREAEQAKHAEELGRWATLVVSNLYRIEPSASSVLVEDWEDGGRQIELKLDPASGTAQEQAEQAFSKARKLRRGSKVIGELLLESEANSAQLSAWRGALVAAAQEDEQLQRLQQEILKKAKILRLKTGSLEQGTSSSAKQSTPAQPSSPRKRGKQAWSGRTLQSSAGIPILVGRNRRENELLSMTIARHPDVWMHARGCPGAHVVLRISEARSGCTPTDECMQMAADLAAFYSDMRNERKATITFTSPKHLKKPKGAPLGAVRLLKEDGTWLGKPGDVPEELKRAREQFDSSESR